MSDQPDQLELSVTIGGASFTGAGAAEQVMGALERFSELVAEHGVTSPHQPSTSETFDASAPTVTEEVPEAAATQPQDSPASKVPLPKFLERDSIKSNPAIATAIVVWAADHDGKSSLSSSEIESRWKGTKLKVPGNIRRDIGVAVKNGWLIREGRTLSATGYGREAIGLSA
jgi:hypothetical protein